MGWSFDSQEPVYIQIARRLRSEILAGKYPAESQFPTVRQLAFEASVNPNTMQRALTKLEEEKLIYTNGTIGRFVTSDKNAIGSARKTAANELLMTFMTQIRRLNFSTEEIIGLIRDTEEPKNDNS